MKKSLVLDHSARLTLARLVMFVPMLTFVLLLPPRASASPLICEAIFSKVKSSDGVTRSLYRTRDGDTGVIELHGPLRAKQIVLLLSGLDRGRTQWDRVREKLQAESPHTLFVQLDLVGQGASQAGATRPTRKISPDIQAEILENLVEQFGWRKKTILVAGHSYGAAIGTHFAARNLGLVKDLVLLAPYVDALETTYHPGMKMLSAYSNALGLKNLYEAQVMFGTQIGTLMSWPFQSVARGSNAKPKNILAMTEGLRDFEMTKSLKGIGQTRITLLRSTFDELIPLQAHQELWGAIPQKSRNSFREIWSIHDSVSLEASRVASEIKTVLMINR